MKLRLFLVFSVSTVFLLEAADAAVSANIVVVPEDHHTGLGHTLLLPCVAFASSNDTAAAVSIGWRHSGESFDANPLLRVHTSQVMMLQGGLTVHKSVLEICVTEVDVSAEYSCVVVNGQDIIEQATFRITVEVPVYLVVAPADVTVNLTETDTHTVAVLCAALGMTRPKITWELNGRPISTNSDQRIKETTKTRSGLDLVVSTLEICPFRSEGGGVYTCTAQTQYSRAQASFKVTTPFTVKPPVSAVQNVTVGKKNVLSCDFHGYPPPTSFGWTFNSQPADTPAFSLEQTQDIGPSGEYVTTSHLHLDVHSVHFRGIYTCMAVDDSPLTKEFQYQVNTQVPAEILIAPVVPLHAITTSVTVSCAAYGIPPPMVTWRYNNNTVIPGGVIETRQQEVEGVYVVTSSMELCPERGGGEVVIDSGQYSCQVGNDVADTQTIATTFDLCFIGDFGFLVTPASSRKSVVSVYTVYYLPCVAFSRSGREISITWSTGGTAISNSDDMSIFEKNVTRDDVYVLRSVLEIKCPTFEDALNVYVYTCSATDGVESNSASINLQFIPDLTTTTATNPTLGVLGGLANKAIGYASYTGSILCILPLLAVAVMHIVSNGPFSGVICTLLSSLFHLAFLMASFSLPTLVLLRLLKNCSRVKLIYLIAMLLNWGLPVLILVICVAINLDDYNSNMSEMVCIPSSWSLWLGVLLPFAASHVIGWITLLLIPIIALRTRNKAPDSESPPRCDRGAFAIGFMLFLFELAWVLQVVLLSISSPSTMMNIAIQSGFIVSSACLGIVTLLSSFFSLPSVKRALFPSRKTSPEDMHEQLQEEGIVPMCIDCKPTDLDHELALLAASNPIIDQSIDESGVVNKQVDL